jgi:hypothetical protein
MKTFHFAINIINLSAYYLQDACGQTLAQSKISCNFRLGAGKGQE